MKILFLSTWFPYPPDNGARNRVYNLLRALGSRHEVYVISLLQEDTVESDAAALESFCKPLSIHRMKWFRPGPLNTLLGVFSSRPRSFVEAFDPAIAQAVSRAVDNIRPDVVVSSQMVMAEYVPKGIPSVLEEHHCWTSTLQRGAAAQQNPLKRFRARIGWMKFATWEARVCRAFDLVTEVCEEDRNALLRIAPDLRDVRVVPNGVNVDYFDPATWSPEPDKLIYNGALTYGANLDAVRHFAQDVYPLLRERCPHAVLRVTGKTTGVDLQNIQDCPGVELTGYVEDIRNVLVRSSVCAVPLRLGGGTRLKILEAMAAGVPVVSTSMGAEGIGATHETHLLIADSPADFAAAVARVLHDAGLAQALSANARAFVEDRYSWAAIGQEFTGMVESVAGITGGDRVAERKAT